VKKGIKLVTGFLMTAFAFSSCGQLNQQTENKSFATTQRIQAPIYSADSVTAIPDQYIVVLTDTTESQSLIQEISQSGNLGRMGITSQSVEPKFIYSSALLGFTAVLDQQTLSELQNDARVAYIEADQTVTTQETQSNPTWGLDRIDQRKLPLSNSYTYNTNASTVHAYILDTGIRLTHNEFTGRIGNGYDAITPGGNANDCQGHGTHVAGTVGGTTYGVAKAVKLHPVRVLSCGGSGSNSAVIAGVDWVKNNHIKPAVANMSLGGGVSNALDSAVRRAVTAGVTFAVSAGNSNANACNFSPARTDTAITVGSTTNADARSSFSNHGSCLDVFAPGSSILSADYSSDTNTSTKSGTSMASPHVAGVAALYLAANPSATPAQVRDAIVNTGTKDVLTDTQIGSPNILVNSLLSSRASSGELFAASGGAWGTWGNIELCNDGEFAYGLRTRIESSQGRGDDTALNTIQLLCRPETSSATPETSIIKSKEGFWGDWSAWSKCAAGEALVSYELKVEGNQGSGDDTAANAVRMGCRSVRSGTIKPTSTLTPGEQRWGSWGGYRESPIGKAICGIQTKVEDQQGGNRDDTALNDVKFFYCDLATPADPPPPPPPVTYRLNVTFSGTGVVASSAIQCGNNVPNCTATLPQGYSETLNVSSGTVLSWSGCDSSTATTCTFTMNADRQIRVAFR
jgi:aqualysin 1